MIETYGKTTSEKLAEESSIARKIVKEISDFGVSERQRYLIMYYLSLELEDIQKVQLISSFLKDNCSNLTISEIFS